MTTAMDISKYREVWLRIAQPNSKQDWKFHACSSYKELQKLVDKIILLFGTSEKNLNGACQHKE